MCIVPCTCSDTRRVAWIILLAQRQRRCAILLWAMSIRLYVTRSKALWDLVARTVNGVRLCYHAVIVDWACGRPRSMLDPSYVASRAAVHELCLAIWTGLTLSSRDELHAAVVRINWKLEPEDHLTVAGNFDDIPSQRTLSDNLSKWDMETLQSASQPYDVAKMNTYAAPGVNRWLDEPPSRTLDNYLSSAELIFSVKLTLGVDVADGNSLCRSCATGVDMKGIHANSCTAGGDCNLRHNQMRDKLYRWALRGRLNPELEKAGILDEPAVTIPSLRRPADVLVDDTSNHL